jgi:hypothetical protein
MMWWSLTVAFFCVLFFFGCAFFSPTKSHLYFNSVYSIKKTKNQTKRPNIYIKTKQNKTKQNKTHTESQKKEKRLPACIVVEQCSVSITHTHAHTHTHTHIAQKQCKKNNMDVLKLFERFTGWHALQSSSSSSSGSCVILYTIVSLNELKL